MSDGLPTAKGGVVIDIDYLTAEALAEPDPRPYVGIQGLLPVIDILYQRKNMTFNDIQRWLAERNIHYTTSHIYLQYRKWEEIQSGIKAALQGDNQQEGEKDERN